MLVRKKDLIKMISVDANISQNRAREVFDSLTVILEDILESGNSVRLNELGKLTFSTHKAIPERYGVIDVKTGEKGIRKAINEHSMPYFKFSQEIKDRVKEASENNVFDK